jgi:hypothetical protein
MPHGLRHQRDAHALRHQRDHREPVAHLVPHLGQEAGIGTDRQDALVVVGRGLAREQHEGLAAQVGRREHALARQRVACGQAAHEGLGQQQAVLQLGRHAAGVHEAQVETVVQQLGDLHA